MGGVLAATAAAYPVPVLLHAQAVPFMLCSAFMCDVGQLAGG